ncbi:unnamed protein product [Gongylonema pulchrum]|uniref:Ig-like domain-containing protein n=1 Tax=Gongylonema pulchrum TaxID=637853 RepID=A0A183CVD2_9BILA|nr:unnamed protein product [Gongylonema pulchrum]
MKNVFSRDYSVIYEDGISILRINRVSENDNAVFSCTASNLFGSARTACRVVVEEKEIRIATLDISCRKEEQITSVGSVLEEHAVVEGSPSSVSSEESVSAQFKPPQFTLSLTDVTIQEGEELELKCIVTGNPTPLIRWTHNGLEILPDDRSIFTVHEDGTLVLKITEGIKEGLYICEATNGIGSAKTQCFVRINRPEISLDKEFKKASKIAAADAMVLSYPTSNLYVTVDVKTRESKVLTAEQQWRSPLRMETIREDIEKEEETATEQNIQAGTLNYIIEAEALTITVLTYKLTARVSSSAVPETVKKDETLLKIIIEEDIVRIRYYLRVVQRSARELWTFGGGIMKRPPHWSRETTHEVVAFERIFPPDEMHEFLEDKDIIERYIKLVEAAERSRSHEERETRFTLRQIGSAAERPEKGQLEIREHIPGFVDKAGSSKAITVQCTANEMRGATEAYIILITRYRYMAAYDVHQREPRRMITGEARQFEALTEDFTRRQKYFSYSTLRPPHFVWTFRLFDDGCKMGLQCIVYGLPSPCIRILHNGRAILPDDRSVSKKIRLFWINICVTIEFLLKSSSPKNIFLLYLLISIREW